MFRKVLRLHGFPSIKVRSTVNGNEEKTVRVLVVDDDPSIRRMIMAALRREGYSFSEAANGKEALEVMKRERPHIVILDLMMPMVSGWDVLRERSTDPDLLSIPVIVISANRSAELASAMDKSICAFLPKPFDISALSLLVRSCMPPSASPA
jgi:two-component system chemotaxis response regulator CheY